MDLLEDVATSKLSGKIINSIISIIHVHTISENTITRCSSRLRFQIFYGVPKRFYLFMRLCQKDIQIMLILKISTFPSIKFCVTKLYNFVVFRTISFLLHLFNLRCYAVHTTKYSDY